MKSDSSWRRLLKSVMKRFGLETHEQAEEVLAQGEVFWRSLDRIDVRARRRIAQWFVDVRKEEQEHFRRMIAKPVAEQSKRQQNLIERTLWWLATKPYLMSRDGYTRAYHVAGDMEQIDAFLAWFNGAAGVIDQYYDFGGRGFRHHDGQTFKVVFSGGPLAASLLDYLAVTNQTLTSKPPAPVSEEELALRRAVRDQLNQAVAGYKSGKGEANRASEKPIPFLIPGSPRHYTRPYTHDGAPPPPESYGPEDWRLMSDLLLMEQIPEKDLEYQAKNYDGWWNKKGRKKFAFQNLRRIARF